MLNSFSKYIKATGLEQETDQLLVAISGGVDSVVLADLLIQSGFRVVLAHMNFGLRGQDSDGDEQSVRELAKRWDVAVEIKKVDTTGLKKGAGVSTQMLARELRYNWFESLCEKYNAKLVTAHHTGDATETFLLNLVRGTGIKGLTGMHFKNNGVYRPLLKYSKKELIDYAKSKGLTWREDKSNQSNDYKRNSLRNEVLPILRKMNPNFDATLDRVASRLENVNELLLEAVDIFKSSWQNLNGEILIPLKGRINPEVLSYSFSEFGFSYEDIQNLIGLIDNNSVGKKVESKSHEIFLDREMLCLVQVDQGLLVNEVLKFGENKIKQGKVSINREAYADKAIISEKVQFFNAEKFKGQIQLRTWREGDVFRPLGMKGKQKVSDFLINNKVSMSQKKKVLVLLVDGEVVWLVGYRISEYFKVMDFNQPVVHVAIDF